MQSFWTFSRDKKGYSGMSYNPGPPQPRSYCSSNSRLLYSSALTPSAAGVTTYVARQFSPVDAKVDCLGHEDEDINREGR